MWCWHNFLHLFLYHSINTQRMTSIYTFGCNKRGGRTPEYPRVVFVIPSLKTNSSKFSLKKPPHPTLFFNQPKQIGQWNKLVIEPPPLAVAWRFVSFRSFFRPCNGKELWNSSRKCVTVLGVGFWRWWRKLWFLVPQTTSFLWMEMVISNHFLYKGLESSNWNNHKKLVGLGVPGWNYPKKKVEPRT